MTVAVSAQKEGNFKVGLSHER